MINTSISFVVFCNVKYTAIAFFVDTLKLKQRWKQKHSEKEVSISGVKSD